MATKTSTEILADLNDILQENSVGAAPWTLDVKKRAINRAIRSTWPHFKIARENTTAVVLSGTIFKYSLAAITDIEDLGGGVGICQVLVQPYSNRDYIPLRRCLQSRDATGWNLHVPEDVVALYNGQTLKLRYYARVPEFVTWAGGETVPEEFANYIIIEAALNLLEMGLAGRGEYDADELKPRINYYTAKALQEKQANTVYCMDVLVGVRAEANG